MVVSVLQQVNAELLYEADHLVKHLCLFIHIDSEVRLISSQIHLLSFFEVRFTFKLTGFVDLNLGIFTFRKIPGDNKLRLIPFVSANVHFKSLNVLTSVDEILFSQVELTNFSVVLGDLSVVRSCDFRRLVLDELNSAVPFSSSKC